MCDLQVNSHYYDKINQGMISHIIVCKEEGIKPGDYISLRKDEKDDDKCVVKVEYVDCEGSAVDENYCILAVKRVRS